MLWVLSIHVAFLAIWAGTLAYFPQLLGRLASAGDAQTRERVMHMQRWLYAMVMTPSAVLTVAAGIWLVFDRGFDGGWLPVKLALVLLMVFFHAHCGRLMVRMKKEGARHGAAFYGAQSLAPLLLSLGAVGLVTAKPF